MSNESNHVGIAFAVVIGAGLATAVGAAVVFFPALVKLANRVVLAVSLGFSTGVMGYVSFIELFPNSQRQFKEGGFNANVSFNLSSLCFFGGIIAMAMLNSLVHRIVSKHQNEHKTHKHPGQEIDCQRKNQEKAPEQAKDRETTSQFSNSQNDDDWGFMCLPGCSDDPANEIEFLHYVATEIENKCNSAAVHIDREVCNENIEEQGTQEVRECESGNCNQNAHTLEKYEQRRLMNMSLATAIAIALHNFPEGLATFVAVLANPSVGVVLAVAIAIHNIPEGLCVALPVYYASGNRRKAFLWGMLSGITEPIAALLGWAVLSNSYSPTLFGVFFGLVAGMMVMISIRELLPTAHRHDPQDKVVTTSVIVGMAVMALSLVLFKI